MLQTAKGWDFATGKRPGMGVKRAERLHRSWASISISSTSLKDLPQQELMMRPLPNRKTMPSPIVGQSRHHPALHGYSWGGGPMLSHCAFFESHARQSIPPHTARSTARMSSALHPAYSPLSRALSRLTKAHPGSL
jgi:hypothetical protein